MTCVNFSLSDVLSTLAIGHLFTRYRPHNYNSLLLSLKQCQHLSKQILRHFNLMSFGFANCVLNKCAKCFDGQHGYLSNVSLPTTTVLHFYLFPKLRGHDFIQTIHPVVQIIVKKVVL